ncbi:hypothetical protein KI387_004407, partial [Taxus chinensis]
GIGEDLMEIPVKCVLEMGNWLDLASASKRAQSRSVGCWVANGECLLRGKGISIGYMIGSGDDGCSSMGGGGNGCSSMGGGGTVAKGSLSGEVK